MVFNFKITPYNNSNKISNNNSVKIIQIVIICIILCVCLYWLWLLSINDVWVLKHAGKIHTLTQNIIKQAIGFRFGLYENITNVNTFIEFDKSFQKSENNYKKFIDAYVSVIELDFSSNYTTISSYINLLDKNGDILYASINNIKQNILTYNHTIRISITTLFIVFLIVLCAFKFKYIVIASETTRNSELVRTVDSPYTAITIDSPNELVRTVDSPYTAITIDSPNELVINVDSPNELVRTVDSPNELVRTVDSPQTLNIEALIPRDVTMIIVDDQKLTQKIHAIRFKHMVINIVINLNWTIIYEYTAEEAFQKYSHNTFDIFMFDENMGSECMKGTEAIKQLRYDGYKGVIIGCSGNNMETIHKSCGADISWGKPTPTELQMRNDMLSAFKKM
jgi:hypothetical protein